MDERLPDPELFRQGGFRVASRLFVEGDIRGDERQVARLRRFAQVQAAVVAVAGVNFAAETVRRLVPGATALQERLGAAGRRHYIKRLTKVFQLDPTCGRHMKAA